MAARHRHLRCDSAGLGFRLQQCFGSAARGLRCKAQGRAEPDVPNPTDVGFLSSLLSDQVDYELSLRRERSDSLLVVELTGPGPYYRCRRAIEAIRRDGRVLSVHVDAGPS